MADRISRFLTAFAGAAFVFLALDAVWLTLMAQQLYRPSIGHLMRPDFDPLPAALFYVVFVTGLVVFVVLPAARVRRALALGALFGLVTYATYDLTNQATLQGWPWIVTLVDLCWGTFVTAVSGAAAHALVNRRAR
jgi:uncharacterized membrane protein